MDHGLPDIAANRIAFRMAFAATAAFVFAELKEWDFSFIAPMLAVQILAALPTAPNLRQGIAIPLTIYIATALALAVSSLFAATPGALLAMASLVIFWTFYGQRRGAPAVVMLLIQIAFCCVPVISTISRGLAQTFADALFWGSAAAVVTVWMAHLLFPAPPLAASSAPPPGGSSELAPPGALRAAILSTLILLPLLVAFIIGGNINNIVILMITLNLLREIEPTRRNRAASVIIRGNVLGGLLAVLAYQWIILANNSFLLFALLLLAAGLWFGGRIARGGPGAPFYAIAFATFILILGLGVSPLPMGSEEAFPARILKILLASAYVMGAFSLVPNRRAAGRPPADQIQP